MDAHILACDIDDEWYYNSVKKTCIKMFRSSVAHDNAQTSCEVVGASLAIWKTQAAIDVFVGPAANASSGKV